MNLAQAINQIYDLKYEWECEGLLTKLSQTDINAMGIIISNLDDLQQENKQLKEQNKKEFVDYTKFKQEQYEEYLNKINKLIKEKKMIKKISSDWEQTCIKLEQQLDLYKTIIERLNECINLELKQRQSNLSTPMQLTLLRLSKIISEANKGE